MGGDKMVEAAAVRLLARREHSTQELRRKLLAKGHEAANVDAALEKLGAKRLVSDDRYVESFVSHHAQRGQGPVRIRAELRRQGIGDERIDRQLSVAPIDWKTLALQVRQRKFGAGRPASLAARAKQARFLQYRGFDTEQIHAALSATAPASGGPDMGFASDLVNLEGDAADADDGVSAAFDADVD
jgi:regulatory protein